MSHPTPWEFHPVHHPSYIDFFEQVLTETTDPVEIEKSSRSRFATDEWYRHLYRTGHAYHGVHPFYMWYWCAHALAAPRPGDHRRRRPRGRAPPRLHAGLDPGTTRSRWPRTSSGRRPRSPTCTPRRSSWRTSTEPRSDRRDAPRVVQLAAARRAVRTDAALGDAPGTGRRGPAPLRGPPSGLLAAGGPVPLAAPTWPESVPRPAPEPELGVALRHAWSRRYPVRLARAMVLDNVARPVAQAAWPRH